MNDLIPPFTCYSKPTASSFVRNLVVVKCRYVSQIILLAIFTELLQQWGLISNFSTVVSTKGLNFEKHLLFSTVFKSNHIGHQCQLEVKVDREMVYYVNLYIRFLGVMVINKKFMVSNVADRYLNAQMNFLYSTSLLFVATNIQNEMC